MITTKQQVRDRRLSLVLSIPTGTLYYLIALVILSDRARTNWHSWIFGDMSLMPVFVSRGSFLIDIFACVGFVYLLIWQCLSAFVKHLGRSQAENVARFVIAVVTGTACAVAALSVGVGGWFFGIEMFIRITWCFGFLTVGIGLFLVLFSYFERWFRHHSKP